jgi:hypothetical protein
MSPAADHSPLEQLPAVPHAPGTPAAPHVSPTVVQEPQLVMARSWPQLSRSARLPQAYPARAQRAASVSGVQPQTFAVPPPPHVCRSVHVPQVAVRVVPQLSAAVRAPQFFPSRPQKAVSLSLVQPHTFGVPPPPQD